MATTPLDMFEFCRNIGKGSYGEVTLARHKRDRKQYVLKKINLKKASTRERKSAEQEAKLLSRLKHPNIVSYKDSFEKEGFLYIAMQYCEGGDLYNKLKEQRGTLLDERQLVEWFVQIAMALQYMHERNILHRDLKTQNIFLTKSKIIKVGDLGIARVLDSSSDMATTLIGTPYYMSPELFSNKPYNYKSDVWALGCCVYEMMTLKHAFNAKDMNSLVYKILRGKMPPMPKQYTTELVSLIRSMLHQDPGKRPTVNRILRDPYIKKNIAIFLEETKQSRRPSSAARSRPSSASSQRSVGSVSSVASSRSRVSEPPPPADEPDTGRSGVSDSARSAVSVSQVDVGPEGDVQSQVPIPAVRQNHRRSPSDGMRPALDPIHENQPVIAVEDDNDSGNDTLTSKSTVKENKAKEETPKPPSPSTSPPRATNAKRKKKSVLSKYARPDSDRSDSGISPKPVDKPRPLPIPPKQNSQGLPQRRNSDYDDHIVDSHSKSSSSSSKEDNMALDDLTPRSLPNMSARERRRRKENSQSYERPHSARVRLVDSSKSTVITNSERKRYEANKPPVRHRQPSLVDDSSSSDEDTLKESENQRHNKEKNRGLFSLPISNGHGTPPTSSHRKHKHQHTKHVNWGQPTPPTPVTRKHMHHNSLDRENKEMNNFISLLDNTLQLNKEDDKSDEEPVPEVKVTADETPRIPKSSSMPSVDTLCNHDRLMARIKALHADCIKGVGWEILKQAYEILGRIEEDEVEPKLVNLMGKERFDLYAGKIWQLKFCEDMARIGLPS